MVTMGLFAIALTFAVAQNSYFGWNWTPKSDAELVCDGINLMLWAMAILSAK